MIFNKTIFLLWYINMFRVSSNTIELSGTWLRVQTPTLIIWSWNPKEFIRWHVLKIMILWFSSIKIKVVLFCSLFVLMFLRAHTLVQSHYRHTILKRVVTPWPDIVPENINLCCVIKKSHKFKVNRTVVTLVNFFFLKKKNICTDNVWYPHTERKNEKWASIGYILFFYLRQVKWVRFCWWNIL